MTNTATFLEGYLNINKYTCLRLIFLVFVFFLFSLFNPHIAIACQVEGDCIPPSINNCIAASKACTNGICKFTWSCTSTCPDWGPWYPSPCSTGEYQTRDCGSFQGVYQIQACGSTGGGSGSCIQWSAVDCPIGTIPDFNQLIGTSTGPINAECGPGTAQTVGDCSNWWYIEPSGGDPGEWICKGNIHFIYQYACVSPCSATAPTNLTYTTSSQTLSWTAGTGGVSQKLYVSTDPAQVAASCTLPTSPGCVVNDFSAVSPYSLAGAISPGTVYYAKVINYKDTTCSTGSATKTLLSSCSMPSTTLNVNFGESTAFNLAVNPSTEITNTTFSSSDTGVATATSPDSAYQFSTTVSGVSIGSSTLTSNVYFGATLACTSATGINVLSPDPWWQVGDSDVSANGDLVSAVPPLKFFGIPGPGGYPGVSAYSGTSNLTSTDASQIGWIANSGIATPKVYGYQYFANQIPADTSVTTLSSNILDQAVVDANITPSYGYYWYRFSGALTGLDLEVDSNLDLGSKKVVILVDSADFNIKAPIGLTDGQGFFLVVASGNITVDPTVTGGSPDLEGLYVTDGTFSSGAAANPLSVRGSVVAYGGLSLLRDLGGVTNAVSPSEYFEFAPDQIMLFPRVLGSRKISWKEVAP